MRAFTAAAVQISPAPGPLTAESIKANCDKAVEYIERCVDATGAELVVLPETVTTGFTPDCGPEALWDMISELPGALLDPAQEVAARLGVHVVWPTYERGPERGVVFNSAALLGPDGGLLSLYRKTHPFCTELRRRGGWVTEGTEVAV
ncbi:MAG: carbon-nitrogen hydrolase family protein, partial [Geodermatophilaceae bacterium]|nr:carbon-nitrogen hydrolase family protein [Geodermatophilaceae bacterium]